MIWIRAKTMERTTVEMRNRCTGLHRVMYAFEPESTVGMTLEKVQIVCIVGGVMRWAVDRGERGRAAEDSIVACDIPLTG